MLVSKRWIMIGVSLALASVMLVLSVGLLAAASGPWRSVGVDSGQVLQLAAADTSLYARTGYGTRVVDATLETMGPLIVARGFMPGSGIWKSTDGGASWQPTSVAVDAATGYDNLDLQAMGVSANGNTVCAAGMYGPPASRIWCSTNGGDSWSSALVPTSSVRALAIRSHPDGRMVAGSANYDDRSLFYSDDDGATWTQATVTGPYTRTNVYALAEGSLYAGGQVDTTGAHSWVPAVYTSTDGVSWTLAYTQASGYYFSQIVTDPSDANRAYGVVVGGGMTSANGTDWGTVYSTTNQGQTWSALSNQPAQSDATSYLAVDSQGRLYAVAAGRLGIGIRSLLNGLPTSNVYRSINNGASWAFIGQTAGGQNISSMAVDPNDDNILYFSSADTDPAVGVYKTPPSYEVGAAVYEFEAANDELRAYQINDMAGNGAQPGTVYAGTAGQGVIRSTDHGQSWSWISNGLPGWATAVAIHPSDANTAYFAACEFFGFCSIYRTDDGGNVWELRSGGLPNEPGSTVFDLALHPGTPTTVYVAGGYGISKTTDSGHNWMVTALVTPSMGIATHPTDSATLYVAADNEAMPGGSGIDSIYKSIDSGASWMQLAAGNSCAKDVLVNPVSPAEVYATGCNGVFLKSTDDGASWSTTSLTETLGIAEFPQGVQSGRLAYDSHAGIIYVALGSYGLVASDDGGATWSKVTGDNVPPMAMTSVFYQAQNDALYLGGSAGLWMRGGNVLFMPLVLKDAS